MLPPLLTTKLYVPPLRPRHIGRARLIARLNASQHRPLVLVSAPAGFGKTTLISEWLAGQHRPAAWLSLDEADNDPARFLSYFVAALQTVQPDIGQDVLRVLQAPQPPPLEALLTPLLNDLAEISQPFTLILDDYHLITAPPIDQALNFLMEHLPPAMQLVIATREDPPLPLHRLRARDQLTELRAADLRFTPAEAADRRHLHARGQRPRAVHPILCGQSPLHSRLFARRSVAQATGQRARIFITDFHP